MKVYRIAYGKFVMRIEVGKDGEVTMAPPMMRRFIGRPFEELERWVWEKDEECTVEELAG
jgi:hypothetical protein